MELLNQPSAPVPSTTISRPIASLKGLSGTVSTIAFSPDRGWLAAADSEDGGMIWDISGTSRYQTNYLKGAGKIKSLVFSPNGKTLVAGSGSLTGWIRPLDVTAKLPREIAILRGARGAVEAVAISPDGKLLAAGGEDRIPRVWDIGTMIRSDSRIQLIGHTAPVRSIAFSPDSQHLATASRDSTVRIWFIGGIRSSQKASLPHPTEVSHVAWSPNGKLIATAGIDGVIRLWSPNSTNLTPVAEIAGQAGPLHVMEYTADSQTLVTMTSAMKVINSDGQTGRPLREYQLSIKQISKAALTTDGRYLAVGMPDGLVDLYRVADKRS